MKALSHSWRALRHRNFQLFFVGQGISVIGSWMTRLATSWLVYRMTHSELLLGVVGFAGQIVPFLLGPVAGVWVERWDRQRLLLWTQIAAALQSLTLAGLALGHVITLWEVIVLSAVQGVINAFDTPGRQSFLIQMVEDRADLSNAIALNSSIVNAARLIGPALAGFVIAATGEGWCFLLDGISYFAVIASLFAMRIRVLVMPRSKANLLEEMREGWDYVRGSRPLRTVLLLFALTSLMGYPYMVLLPVFAVQVLHGGPHTLGLLAAASGVGALISALSLAARKSVRPLIGMLPVAAAALGVALLAFGMSRVVAVSMVAMVFAGFGLMQVASGANTLIQSLVTDNMRARVISYYAMAFFGAAPVGSLLAGALAARVGAAWTVELTGFCCVLGALWFWRELPKVDEEAGRIYGEVAVAPCP